MIKEIKEHYHAPGARTGIGIGLWHLEVVDHGSGRRARRNAEQCILIASGIASRRKVVSTAVLQGAYLAQRHPACRIYPTKGAQHAQRQNVKRMHLAHVYSLVTQHVQQLRSCDDVLGQTQPAKETEGCHSCGKLPERNVPNPTLRRTHDEAQRADGLQNVAQEKHDDTHNIYNECKEKQDVARICMFHDLHRGHPNHLLHRDYGFGRGFGERQLQAQKGIDEGEQRNDEQKHAAQLEERVAAAAEPVEHEAKQPRNVHLDDV